MSILSRNSLKSNFVAGTAATESKFSDLFDSHYNKNDDSVLLGPTGITGSYGIRGPIGGTANGLIGPTGATFYKGLWLSEGPTPGSSSSTGSIGQVVFEVVGPTANTYIHIGSQWIRISGVSNF